MDFNLKEFIQLPIMAILRGVDEEHIRSLANIFKETGLNAVEITMNTKNAGDLIVQLKRESDNSFAVGAGTVLNEEDLNLALKCGASFIVSPVMDPQIVSYCVEQSVPVFPGAFTPQEIYQAWKAGATMVKVFPAKFFGPDYIKEIKAPLDQIRLLACGGVNQQTIRQFFNSGADAVAIGASVFQKDLLDKKNYGKIKANIEMLIEEIKN